MLKYFPDKKIFTVPLPYFFSSNRPVNCEKPNNIGVFGRLNNKQKNIILACKISKYLNCKILLYGSNGSNDEKIHQLVKKYPNIEYKGGYKREDLPEIYKNIKYQLVPSKFEGFGYVCVEALANSVPLIVRDTFPSASFLIDGKNNGIKFKKHTFPRKIAKLIENFISKNNYQNMQKKCYEFYSKYLTIEKFNEA
jgi:glycosyltransferase involved in cell wall biosynthesis